MRLQKTPSSSSGRQRLAWSLAGSRRAAVAPEAGVGPLWTLPIASLADPRRVQHWALAAAWCFLQSWAAWLIGRFLSQASCLRTAFQVSFNQGLLLLVRGLSTEDWRGWQTRSSAARQFLVLLSGKSAWSTGLNLHGVMESSLVFRLCGPLVLRPCLAGRLAAVGHSLGATRRQLAAVGASASVCAPPQVRPDARAPRHDPGSWCLVEPCSHQAKDRSMEVVSEITLEYPSGRSQSTLSCAPRSAS